MDNLELWEKVREVPDNAKKKITGGRLVGKTEINPMWRIKELTKQYGICGVGWKYVITDQFLEEGANGEKSAFVNIDLFVFVNNRWSDAIQGTGGSSFVAKEKSGMHTSDECFKMALTDAISVACKALGFGADVYWNSDVSKYNKPDEEEVKSNNVEETPPPSKINMEEAKAKAKETEKKVAKELGDVVPPPEPATATQISEIKRLAPKKGALLSAINKNYGIVNLSDICWTDAKHCIDELKKRKDVK